uniref:Uncharacterized protein n=1 Tax=Alexandrium catenella TaxID=2925 RepID=A0A7S1WMI4_ALECA
MMSSKAEEIKMRFLRITLLGASNSGKTALINCYVNSHCPLRYYRTEKAMVYYKKVDIDDESEYTEALQPILLEIEDTPGSERGNDDEEDDRPRPNDIGDPKPRLGARVVVEKDRNRLISFFEQFRPKGKIRYRPAMDGMLGKEFTVKLVAKDGSFGLPSPDGSEGGVWNFPPGAISLKVALTLPIDEFLCLGEKKKPEFKNPKEMKHYNADLITPCLAYHRPVGAPEMDKTLTRNRMGYFICFDLSDDEGDSLREAMALYNMLKKALTDKKHPGAARVKPYVWLVGAKQDKASDDAYQKNRDSAQVWSEQEEIPFYQTSARTHKGVSKVFEEMQQAISSRENLWSLQGVDCEEVQDDDQKGCSVQ